jgi:hypothetical protein
VFVWSAHLICYLVILVLVGGFILGEAIVRSIGIPLPALPPWCWVCAGALIALGVAGGLAVLRRRIRPITVYDVARYLVAGIESEEIDAEKRARRVAWVKDCLRAVAAGNSACSPSYFDGVMADYGLTPEDIDSTPEQIESAKAAWVEKQVS